MVRGMNDGAGPKGGQHALKVVIVSLATYSRYSFVIICAIK